MRISIIALLFIVLTCCVANSQWTQIYQTDSCHCTSGTTGRYRIDGMAFFARDSGIVIGNNIATTIDGGITWHEINWDTSIIRGYSYAFSDINHIWVNNAPYIYRSSDGGLKWERDSISDSLGYSVRTLYFLDSLNGVAGGGGMTMFRTTNGGKDWRRVHDPELEAMYYPINYIAFATPEIGIATTYDVGTWVLVTNDGGMNWKFTTNIYQAVANRSVALSYPDPHHAFFCTPFTLYRSVDSGETWKGAGNSLPAGNNFRSMIFADSLHGIAALTGPFRTAYTSDGGNNWQLFILDPSEIRPEYFLSFPNSEVAYVNGFDAVFKLNMKDISIVHPQQPNEFSSSLEIDRDDIIITIPKEFPGVVRIVDLLGRMIKRLTIAPGSKAQFTLQELPSQLFIEVRWKDQFKVFKVLH